VKVLVVGGKRRVQKAGGADFMEMATTARGGVKMGQNVGFAPNPKNYFRY
jgi:hypothetical protein